MILVDGGPLIALLHRDDRNHDLCVSTLRSLREPLGTAWPVVTEAMYLLGFSWRAQDRPVLGHAMKKRVGDPWIACRSLRPGQAE
jgi:predicted nucleic acid-binding protein